MTQEPKIVIVASSQSRRHDLSKTLGVMGREVAGQAGDATGARLIIQGVQTNLVILDHDPPDLEGPQAARAILGNRRFPVLLLHREEGQVSNLVRAALKAGVTGICYWKDGVQALETGIAYTMEWFHERQDTMEMSAAARLVVEAGRDIVIKRERLNRSQALTQLRRESRRRNLNLIDYAFQVTFGNGRPGFPELAERLKTG